MAEIPEWARKQKERKEKGLPAQALEEQVDPDTTGEITQFHPYQDIPDGNLLSDVADYIARNFGTEWALALEPGAKAQEGILQSRLGDDYRVEYSPKYDATIVQDPEGQVGFVNRPGMSQRDVTNFSALAGLFAPASRGFGLGSTPASGATLSAGYATGIEGLRQLQSRLFGSEANEENIIPGVDLSEMALAGATQYLPDWLIGRSQVQRRAPMGPPDIANRIARNEQAATSAGLQATRGQLASDVPSEVEDLRALSMFPETSPAIADRFAEQNVQAQDATTRLVETMESPLIQPSQMIEGETGLLGDQIPLIPQDPSERFKTATDQLRGGLVEVRKRASEDLYERAKGRPPVETTQLQSQLGSIIQETAPGSEANRTLTRIQKMVSGEPKQEMVEGIEVLAPAESRTIEQLHDAKEEIDALIQKAEADGNNSLVMRLTRAQQDLVEFVQDNSPLYKEARETFAELSQPIDQFDQSILGTVQRMDPQNAYRLGELIFNPRLPNSTRSLIQQRLQLVDPMAFRLLAGDVIRTRLSRISDVSPGAVQNVPYKINQAIFKNQQERDMWKAAFPELADDIDALSQGLQIISKGRDAGSPTATRTRLIKDRGYESSLPQTAAQAAADLIAWLTVVPKAAEVGLGGARDTLQRSARLKGLQRQMDTTPEGLQEMAPAAGREIPMWITNLIQAGRGTLVND